MKKDWLVDVALVFFVMTITIVGVRMGPGWLASYFGVEESAQEAQAKLFKAANAGPSDHAKVRDLCRFINSGIGIRIPDDAESRQALNRCSSLGYL